MEPPDSCDPEQILIIRPTAEECKLNNMVKCTQESCHSIFSSESNLNLHLVKTHKVIDVMQKPCAKQYYCPELNCVYHAGSYFKNLKYLRQHYLKRHSVKNFICTSCSKGFPCQNYLRLHEEYCGIDFACSDCTASYACYETLKTHGRRKKHNVLSKTEFRSQPLVTKNDSDSLVTNKNCSILPKSNQLPNHISLIIIPSIDKAVFHQESQTMDDKSDLNNKRTQINRNLANLTSQQTQTGNKNVKLTVETQTIGDFIDGNKKAPQFQSLLDQKSSKTQTDIIESKNSSCNTSFTVEDFEINEMISSGTQTENNIFSASTVTQDSIYTDTSDLLTLNENICSFEFDNCHMETQTDFMIEEDMFNCDYMSNTYTQTCGDILDDFGFSDIQTQTVFDDMLRSVESQTMMSQNRKNNREIRYVANMETQTDIEFRMMLEVINS